MNADPAPPGCRPGPAIQALLGILVLVVGLWGLPAEQYIGDPQAVRMVTWSLLERGRLDVPADLAQGAGERGQYFVQNPDNGLYYSKYGELNSLGYLPAMALERALLGRLEPFNDLATRTVLLNLNNLALSLILAGLLLALACLFTRQPALALVWVLATLYASFGWNYLRAQTTELLQWTLCTGFFWALFQLWRSRGQGRWLGLVHLFLVGLLLTKAVYVLLVPCLLLVGLLVLPSQASRPRALLGLLGPLVLMALLVAGLNELKFGSPFSTGYTQWVRERDLFRGDLWAGLRGFLVDPQRSLFLHQPLLLPALVALPAFFRRWRVEAFLACGTLAVFLLFHAQTANWAGHWSYGPRYLLAVLAPATLPALLALEWLSGRLRTPSGAALAALLGLILAGSIWLQVQVNSLGFFTCYQVEAAVRSFPAPRALAVLQAQPFGVVNGQLRSFVRTGTFPLFLKEAACELSPEQTARLAGAVRQRTRGNRMFFPGP